MSHRTVRLSSNPVLERNPVRSEPSVIPSHTRLRTLCLPCPSNGSITRVQVEHFIMQWSNQLIRAKGDIKFAAHQETQLMQFAGKRIYWEKTRADTDDSYIVLIGLDMDIDLIKQSWARLLPSP
ncbi:hypothetical protein BVG16_30675 [Paenibacillus selenitireducens]|uniref:CobW C-terminal domain-containing protein n=2 Tax=Paenibacillus selenitireducens TaxID=1324314 RepID=A0A1T2WZN5_9BACL|nr:GTP-binding protein [Paenibacillus selenitireducens]OPA73035.1 hypothetical protein BVG16_30675 [Paenibacillus selenitireducens]